MNAGMAGRDGGQIFRSIAASMLAESSTGSYDILYSCIVECTVSMTHRLVC